MAKEKIKRPAKPKINMPQFVVFQGTNGEWYWHLEVPAIGAKPEIIADGGEGYKNKFDCIAEIIKLKKHAMIATIVDKKGNNLQSELYNHRKAPNENNS